jgi:hypothetical protein
MQKRVAALMMPLETAILRTILYADVFNFPMTIAEIQHFLISEYSTTRAEIEQMAMSCWLIVSP